MLSRVEQLNLDNKIRVISKEIFDILIKQEKINFDFIQDNQVKFVGMEERLIKTEIQSDALQKKFDQKFTTASLLINDMNQFKKSAQISLIALTNSLYQVQNTLQMNNDSSKERQGFIAQIKNATVNRIQNQMISIRSDVKLNRQHIIKRLTEDTHKLNLDVSSIRIVSNSLEVQFQKVMMEMKQRQNQLQQVIGNIKNFELNEKETQQKLKIVFDQLELRPMQVQFVDLRRSFQNKLNSEISALRSNLLKITSKVQQNFEHHSILLQRINLFELDVQGKLIKHSTQLSQTLQSVSKTSSLIQKVSSTAQIDAKQVKNVLLDVDQLFKDVGDLRTRQQQLNEFENRVENLQKLTEQIQLRQKQTESPINQTQNQEEHSKRDTLISESQYIQKQQVKIFKKTAQLGKQQQKQLQKQHEKIKTQQTHRTKNQIKPSSKQIQTRPQSHKRSGRQLRAHQSQPEIGPIVLKFQQTLKGFQNQILMIKDSYNSQNQVIKSLSQKQDINLSSVSQSQLQINNNLLKISKRVSTLQTKCQNVQTTTGQIKEKWQSIGQIIKKVQGVGMILNQMEERVKQSQGISNAMTLRAQQINNIMVRTRSDFTIKFQNIMKQQSKISTDARGMQKILSNLITTFPILVQANCILIAKQLNQQNFKRASHISKFTSMTDGVIYSIEDKVIDQSIILYRGQSISTVTLLTKLLQFMIDHVDSIRASNKGVYVSGKEVYKNIVPKTEGLPSESAQTRVRSLSKSKKPIL